MAVGQLLTVIRDLGEATSGSDSFQSLWFFSRLSASSKERRKKTAWKDVGDTLGLFGTTSTLTYLVSVMTQVVMWSETQGYWNLQFL